MQADLLSGVGVKRHHNSRPDHEMIEEFSRLGKYPEGTLFYRDSGERWNIWCPSCANDEYARLGIEPDTFTASPKAIRSGLLACRCSRFYHWGIDGRSHQLKRKCDSMGYTFVAFDGPHNVRGARVRILCREHGEWTCAAGDILNKSHGCKSCAINGFNPSKQAILYCLKSACGGFLKVGITNNMQTRMRALKNATPFDFIVLKESKMHGADARSLEKQIHDSYESADLRGFSGATEWMVFHHDILRCFK
jgi:hypothetical protein